MGLFKKISAILFLVVVLISCNTKSRQNSEDSQITDTVENHTALNSLDWQGEYAGVVPCADCEGIETTLILKEPSNYVLRLKYLGKSDSLYSSEGFFEWHKDGMRISLENEKYNANSYLVGENQVFLLDKSGAKIKGDLDEYYVLLKK